MKKRLSGFPVLLLLFAFSACGGRNAAGNGAGGGNEQIFPQARSAAQVIVLSDSLIANQRGDTVKMGKIRSGEIVTKPLTVRNDGDKPLVIIDVDKTCGCVDLDYPRQPLRAGEEAPMELEFDSRGLNGWIYKTVYIKTSSDAGNYTLVVTADVE